MNSVVWYNRICCTIQQNLHKNNFQKHHLNNIFYKINNKSRTQRTDEIHDARKPIKWATFTYMGTQNKIHYKIFQEHESKNRLQN